MESLSIPIDEDRAGAFIDTIKDRFVQNFVGMAFAHARLELSA